MMRTIARRHLCALVSTAATLGILGVVDCDVSGSYHGAAARSALHDAGEMDPKQDRARRPAVHERILGRTDHAHDKVSDMNM